MYLTDRFSQLYRSKVALLFINTWSRYQWFNPFNYYYVCQTLMLYVFVSCFGPDRAQRSVAFLSFWTYWPIETSELWLNLFNYCIDVGEWPCQWKLSNVTPFHKKDNETSKKNYHPISVLSVITKVFEKLKFDQLYSVFTSVFSDNMSGFLRGHSCCSALLKLTDDWRQALDNKKDVAVIAIDLSKAFDSICHNLLLAKLKAYGVHDSAIKLIQSYLSGRFQRVKCNGKVSDWLPLRCGVPQGSLLRSTFFKISLWMMSITQLDLPSYVCVLMTQRNIWPMRAPAHLNLHCIKI